MARIRGQAHDRGPRGHRPRHSASRPGCALAAFAAGFFVRPFGALFFGRIGDIVGRKNTFLVTMAIMGLSTFVVGLLPGYDQIGVAAPILLIALPLGIIAGITAVYQGRAAA